MKLASKGVLVAAVIGVVGCSGVFSGGDHVRVAYIDWYYQAPAEEPLFVVPDTMVAGANHLVRFRSMGLNGCYSLGSTEVKKKGTFDVTVRGFDRSRDGNCTQAIVYFFHETSVRFDEPGEARVRIVGRRHPSGEEVEVFREVVVLPQ